MTASSVESMLHAIQQYQLLSAVDYHHVIATLPPGLEDPPELARILLAQNLITIYQARKLYQGKASELVIGPYVLLDKLGEGGMGRVYKAKQLRLQRIVALKVVQPQLVNNPVALGRFRREARAAGQLDHPNIVRLIDAEEIGDHHTLVMEYVDGLDLSRIIKDRGPLPIDVACRMIREAALGLAHAHKRGIIHRDIKPANILVAIDAAGNMGPAKILDMGLARPAFDEPNSTQMTALTQEGTVVGTPDYMAPEQAKNSRTVDHRADLYSLGCTMFFLLTGRPPFIKGNTMEKLLSHQLDPAPLVGSIRAGTPPMVEAIVQSLLAKSPADRFEKASHLAAALEKEDLMDLGAKPAPKSGAIPPSQPTPSTNRISSITTPISNEKPSSKVTPAMRPATPMQKPKLASAPDLPFDFEAANRPAPTREEPKPHHQALILGLLAVGVGVILLVFVSTRMTVAKVTTAVVMGPQSITPPVLKTTPKPPPVIRTGPTKAERDWAKLVPPDTAALLVVNLPVVLQSPMLRGQLVERFDSPWKQIGTFAGMPVPESLDRLIVMLPFAGRGKGQAIVLIQALEPMTTLRSFLDLAGNEVRGNDIPNAFSPIYPWPQEKFDLDRTYATFLDDQTLAMSEDRRALRELVRSRLKPNPPSAPKAPPTEMEQALARLTDEGLFSVAVSRRAFGDNATDAPPITWATMQVSLDDRLRISGLLAGPAELPIRNKMIEYLLFAGGASFLDKRLSILGEWAASVRMESQSTPSMGLLKLTSSVPANGFSQWLGERMDEVDPVMMPLRLIGSSAAFRRLPQPPGTVTPMAPSPIP